jgi:hypothetical protein
MRRILISVLFATGFVMGLPATDRAYAGDEVDYSAPYMTVENGQLVTKYPAREHIPGDPAPQALPADDTGTPDPAESRARIWLPAVVVPVLGLVAFLVLQRRRTRDTGIFLV